MYLYTILLFEMAVLQLTVEANINLLRNLLQGRSPRACHELNTNGNYLLKAHSASWF